MLSAVQGGAPEQPISALIHPDHRHASHIRKYLRLINRPKASKALPAFSDEQVSPGLLKESDQGIVNPRLRSSRIQR